MKALGSCILRRATKADGPAVWALIAEVLRSYGIQADGETTDADLLDLETAFADDQGRFWVLMSGEALIGTVALRFFPQARVELCRMYLSPQYRRRGLGRAMMEHALAEAEQLGARTLFLKTASVLTEAISLYRSFGFHVVDCCKTEGNCDTMMERPSQSAQEPGPGPVGPQSQTGTCSTISRL